MMAMVTHALSERNQVDGRSAFQPVPEGCAYELFEQQVARTPDAVAVRFGPQWLSYEELNGRANRLARHLREHCGDELSRVGICLDHGIDTVVAVLGILKSGAAYVPVDMGYPLERQSYILSDADVSAVIARGDFVNPLSRDVLRIDPGHLDLSRSCGAPNLGKVCTAQDLAYIMYTSGPTGQPKGVCMPHRAVVNLVAWQIRNQANCARSRTLQFSPLSAGVSFQEIFSTLTSGGELVLISNPLRLDPVALLAFIAEHQVERIFLPHVALNRLAVAADAADCYPQSLVDVVTAGEQLVITQAIRQFFNTLSRCRLHNQYGPTETHVVTAHTLEGSADRWPSLPPIGMPIDHVEIHVLDAEGRSVADDVPGELCVAGIQLARGYHKLPEETAARFVDLAIDGRGPRQFYRTGDLGRRRSDGLLEALGRIDGVVEPLEDALERMVAEVWSEALGVRNIGRTSSFFSLGGNSVLGLKVMSELRRRGYRIDALTLYRFPELSELATYLRTRCPREEVSGPECALAQLKELRLSQGETDTIIAAIPGGWANIKEIAPLGPVQHGMMYHYLMGRSEDPYLLWQVVRFSGLVLLLAYIDALRQTIARHDPLRVSIHYDGLSQPVQVVWREAPLSVQEVVAAGSDADPLSALKRCCKPDAQRFDITQAPLQRCLYCYDTTRNEWVLLHVLHHIAADHATVERMQQEIEARLLSIPPDAVESMSLKQVRASLFRASVEEETAFFARMLADYDPPPAIFGMRDYLPGSVEVCQVWRPLPHPLCADIRQQAKSHSVSVAAVFHLAWAKVIACLTGRDDVAFGTVLLGRMGGDERAAQTMGQFINTLPIRLRLNNLPVSECLRSAQAYLMQLVRYEQAPLALAQKSVRMPGATQLFTSVLNYRHSGVRCVPANDPFQAVNPSKVPGLSYSGIMERGHYPIAVNVDDFATDFVVNIQLEQGQDPERICDYFETALQQIVMALDNAPELRIGRVNAMPAHEILKVLRQWNETESDVPRHICLQAIIQEQVGRTPRATAVVFEANTLTYEQLNARANQLARFLGEDLGVGPDRLVAVCVERSIEMVVALLAILKAGGAYVPLDPYYPADRLSYMLRDSAPRAVLTHAGVPGSVRGLLMEYALEASVRVIDLNGNASQWSGQRTNNVDPMDISLGSSHLAYVIYTSGSTGRPKGVMNEHRGVVNRLVWMQRAYPLGADDAVLQKTPFSFDVSVWEIFWPLMYGARLVIARPEGHKDPSYLSDVIREHGITTLHFVPSMLSSFLEQASQKVSENLRRVFCSGEALPARSVRWFRDRFPTVELHNLYGPTEAAVDVTAWDCRKETGDTIPIGRPIDNIRLYILDSHGQPVPVGVAGELHIAGVGVARGYLNQPELTAEKFIADPFSPAPGQALMFRTGDVARYLPSGNIEYLGRNDFQIKLRGFRIELGEVEAAMRSHNAVSDCVALVREDTVGDTRLVAYAIPATVDVNGSPEPLSRMLREHLQARLPAYMVPSHLIWLDAFPLSANGKLDRKALPSALDVPATPSITLEPPREGTEAALARLWAQLLMIRQIGRQSHFFEAGGHSLLAVTLMAQIRREFGVSISLSTLVSRLDLASQAELIDAQIARRGAQPGADVAAPADRLEALLARPIRALPSQKAIYKAVKLNSDDVTNNSFVALSFERNAAPDLKDLNKVLQSVFSRHESLSAQFILSGNELYLKPAKRFVFRLEKRHSLGSFEADVWDFVRPFSLEDGMNVRGRWVSDERRSLLLLDFSHASIDGVGIRQILAELSVAGGGRTLPVAGLAAYSDFFYSNRFAEVRREHADFWLTRLESWSPVLLPEDTRSVTRNWCMVLDGERKAQIQACTSRLKISIPEFFLSVFLRFKAGLEDRTDQLTAIIFHGRDTLAQQAIIAPLVTVLPVRVSLKDGMADVLQDVSAAARDACRHYLFDAEELAARCPAICRHALFPTSVFGHFQKEGFTGHIAGAPCRQLETPKVASGQLPWTLACEVAEHAAGFDVHIEAVSFRALRAEADWEELFNTVLQDALATQ